MSHQRHKAQILIEVMFGMAFVSVVLVALISLSLRAIRIQLASKLQQQAEQLQREAMEGVRQIRDGYGFIEIENDRCQWVWSNADLSPANCAATQIWEDSAPTFFRLYYDRDLGFWIMQKTAASQTSSAEYHLQYDSANSTFGYHNLGSFTSNTDSVFYRQIQIEDVGGGATLERSKTIIANLAWTQGNQSHESTIASILSMW